MWSRSLLDAVHTCFLSLAISSLLLDGFDRGAELNSSLRVSAPFSSRWKVETELSLTHLVGFSYHRVISFLVSLEILKGLVLPAH